MIDAQAAVGFRIIQFADHNVVPQVVQIQRLRELGDQDNVGDAILAQFFYQVDGDRVEMGENDVAGEVFRHPVRCAGLVMLFQPGRIEKLDEGKGQHHQQKNNAAEQNHHRKDFAGVAGEGDVTEAQGGHGRQGPVKTGDPGIIAVFVDHQNVKDDAVENEKENQHQGELEEQPHVASLLTASEQKGKLCGHRLHQGFSL